MQHLGYGVELAVRIVGIGALVAACSSETTIGGAKCGAGTTLNDKGECVPIAGSGGSGGTGLQDAEPPDSSAGGSGGVEESGVGGTAGVAGNAGAAGTITNNCPTGLPGPKLIEVPKLSLETYCIDATEVTTASYRTFVGAKGSDMSGQPDNCSWNTTYKPETDGPCKAVPADNEPIVCIDWCDAYMYCTYAGKHLCTRPEWTNACSGGPASLTYPYGNTFEPKTCNTMEYEATSAVPVGSVPGCHGLNPPFDQIYDMSGNVGEWLDFCPGDCHVAGGGWASGAVPEEIACSESGQHTSMTHSKAIGFRCCGSVPP